MTNELKLYFIVDNGDSSITGDYEACIAFIKADMEGSEYNDTTPDDDLPEYTMNPVWMTEEEFDNLPEYQG